MAGGGATGGGWQEFFFVIGGIRHDVVEHCPTRFIGIGEYVAAYDVYPRDKGRGGYVLPGISGSGFVEFDAGDVGLGIALGQHKGYESAAGADVEKVRAFV